jgi:UDP-glucose 6-dehydrogenase
MKVLLIGKGQVGTALANIISKQHDLTTYDIEAAVNKDMGKYDVMHICIPWHTNFVNTVVFYIRKFKPHLTLIESTVKPETTKKIHSIESNKLICHSPVRGCHSSLLWGLQTYTKFIGPTSIKAGLLAQQYYETLHLKTYLATSSTETECSKLFNLSYYAAQIAYFQEVERKVTQYNLNYEDVEAFFQSTTEDSRGKVQRPIFQGNYIGGTCVMPGLRLIFNPSSMWKWIKKSNDKVKCDELLKLNNTKRIEKLVHSS